MSESAREPRATVCISVDFDAVSLWMQWGARGVRALSRGEFGATVGAPRLLELFQRYGLITTWFVPGHTADTYPQVTARVSAEGHEIANHGYLHEEFGALTDDAVRTILRKANDSLQRVTGQRPEGFRLPAGDATGTLFEVLVEEGFSYDSSLYGHDFQAYWCRSQDQLSETEGNVLGEPIDLVEVPSVLMMNDFHHFEFNYGNPSLIGHDDADHVYQIWRAQFDFMWERYSGSMLMVLLHPQCIGQGMRMGMLEQFIEHCLSKEGTVFRSASTVASEFREREANVRT